ncbi:MAG: hypothetical protein AAGA42_15520 [Actinomycetota bacterium]
MTPTLSGRIQTRLAVVLIVGGVWTLLIGSFLPRPAGATTSDMYAALYTALLVVAIVGVAWELLYHGLQQFRWEKDWPTIFGLVVGVPEGIVAYQVLNAGLPWDQRALVDGSAQFPLPAFLIMFITTWVLVWAVVNGPMQVMFIRWRFRGGRFNDRW